MPGSANHEFESNISPHFEIPVCHTICVFVVFMKLGNSHKSRHKGISIHMKLKRPDRTHLVAINRHSLTYSNYSEGEGHWLAWAGQTPTSPWWYKMQRRSLLPHWEHWSDSSRVINTALCISHWQSGLALGNGSFYLILVLVYTVLRSATSSFHLGEAG